jgi:hypothetical protein
MYMGRTLLRMPSSICQPTAQLFREKRGARKERSEERGARRERSEEREE